MVAIILFNLVGMEGLEPSRYYYRQILSLLRLPITPHARVFILKAIMSLFFSI